MGYIQAPKRGFGLYYDPIYGYTPLPPIIRKALDLPSMQRLRHIKQLSTLFLFFPGATHSRFEHSVGVCHLAERVFNALFTKREHFRMSDWPEFQPVHRIALQLGALFHDLGHGPWSHVSELFCAMKEDYRRLRHKELTEEWIKRGVGPYTDVPNFLVTEAERIENEWKTMVKQDKWAEIEEYMKILAPENVAAIAVGKPPSDAKYTFLSNIVSGIFDVDRMDYLRRDAYHAGVEIGSIDIWEIIHSYTLAEENGKWIAMLLPSASTAVEILLAVRDLTYRQFYYNQMHRSAQEMMIRAMVHMVDKYSLDELICMNDEELLVALESEKGDAFTKDIAKRIRLRAIYEPLPFTISVSTDLDQSAKSKWAEVAYNVPLRDKATEEWLRSEENISKKLKLPVQHTAIFDIRPVPLVERNEYETPIFYDEVKKESQSLFDLAPHLRLTRGTRLIRFNSQEIKIDLTQQYIEEVSKLFITMPFEYLNTICENCKKEIAEGKKANSVFTSYAKELEKIIDELVSFLQIKDEEKIKKLREKFASSIAHYLETMCLPTTMI